MLTGFLVRMRGVRRAVSTCVVFLALNPVSVTHACSCRQDSSLESQYGYADNVLIARISGCAPDRLYKDGYCRSHGWTFETIEDLKGSDAVVRAQPWDADGAVSSCDIALKVGETYLLFLREGRTGFCSGTVNLSSNDKIGEIGSPEVGARQIEVLRAYRDGVIDRVTAPWYFIDRGWGCAIEHHFGGAHVRFSYLHAWPPNARPPGAGPVPDPGPYFSVVSIPRAELVGPTLLEVDGDAVPLTRQTVTIPDVTTYSREGVEGDAVLRLLDTMNRPVEVVFSGTRSSHGGVVEHFRATTHTALFRDAAARFAACMAAHAGQAEESE